MSKKIGRARARIAALAATGLAATTIVIATTTNADAAGVLGDLSFSATNNTANATGVSYTWAFTAPTGGTLTSIDLGTTGTGGTATVGAVYGLDCTLSAAGPASNKVTLTGSSCTVPAGQSIGITIGGLSNGASGAPGTSTVTVTYADASTDTASATLVDTVSQSTAVSVLVPESLTLDTNTSAISLTAIPGVVGKASQDVALTVVTNASSYALHACVSDTAQALGDGHSHYIKSSNQTTATALGNSNDGLGANVASSGASLASPWTGTTATGSGVKLGYTADCTDAGSIVATGAPTIGDTVTFTNYVYAKGTQAAGTYTGTISYSAVPTF
jgi:hypothetical protein